MFIRFLLFYLFISLCSFSIAKDNPAKKKQKFFNSIKHFLNYEVSNLHAFNLKNKHFFRSFIQINGTQNIELKSQMLNLLYQHLYIINKINTLDLDDQQIKNLKKNTLSEVNQIFSTFGYINNKVQVIVDKKHKELKIEINLDKRVIINSYNIKITGPIILDPDYNQYIKSIHDKWLLTVGKPFNQNDWEQSKRSSLGVIKIKKYPLAKITNSIAKLNPTTYKADLLLEIESANLIKFGDIEIQGLKRYPQNIITDLATFKIDDDYNYQNIIDFNNSLANDPHFESAELDTDLNLHNLQNGKANVKVVVKENPKNKLDIGIGVDTIEKVEAYLGYTYFNLFSKGYINSIIFKTNKYEKRFSIDISQPVQPENNFYTANIDFISKKRSNIKSKQFSTHVWKVYVNKNFEYKLGLEFFSSSSHIQDFHFLGKSYLSMLTSYIKYNSIYPQLQPENGIYILGQVSTTLGKLASTSSIQKYYLNGIYYFTPRKHQKIGTFIFRNTLGYINVLSRKKNILEEIIPADILFKAGGPNSIRGYEISSIGVLGKNNSILGGKVLVVLSAEYQLPISKNFNLAIFHDVGNVKNKFRDFKLLHSTGIGIRWFNIFAPISFDIAYKHNKNIIQKRQKFGWYINLGTHF